MVSAPNDTMLIQTSLKIDYLSVYPPETGLTGGLNFNDNGVVGTIGGTVDVSSLGGATYTIPIEVPAGINGMQPNMVIAYNSQAGNGLLGYGWELTGISSITRTGSTLFHDGKMTAVNFSDGDRFLLDGQRLIQVESNDYYAEYKTEQDEFSKIIFYKGGDDFTHCVVRQADGNIIYYGMDGDDGNSRLMSRDSHVIKWMVSRVEDRNGNAMTYHYDNSQTTGEIYISHIDYTKNEKAKVDAEFSVNFEYEKRADAYSSFIGGCKIQHTKILKGITVTRDSKELEKYTLKYDSWTDLHYMLTKVSLTKDGVHVNPTTIRWNLPNNENVYNALSESQIDMEILDDMTFMGDFNGDGYTDLLTVPYKYHSGYSNPEMKVFLNDKAGSFPQIPDYTMLLPDSLEWVHVADLNGDGYDDIIVHEEKIVSTYSVLTTMTIYETSCDNGEISFNEKYSIGKDHRLLLKFGDFLGTGHINMLVMPVNLGFDKWESDIVSVVYYVDSEDAFKEKEFNNENIFYFGNNAALTDDFNGDGIMELMLVKKEDEEGGIIVLFDTISGTTSATQAIAYDDVKDMLSVYTGDFNGDGMADILFNKDIKSPHSYPATENAAFVRLSNGNGFEKEMKIDNEVFKDMAFPTMKLYSYSLDDVDENISEGISVTDIDGDGKTDIVWYNHKNTYFLRNFSEEGKFKTICKKSNTEIKFLNRYFAIGNFLGRDNMSFMATKESKDKNIFVFSLKSNPGFFSVNNICDGMGALTEIEYGYLMPGEKSVYSYGNRPCEYDARPAPIAIMAMKAHTVTGGDIIVRNEYRYSNAVFHRNGRGFLGFEGVARLRSVNGCVTELQSSRFEMQTMQDNVAMLPECDTTYVFSEGRKIVSQTHEYHFHNVRSSLGSVNGRYLVIRPAMSSYVTKVFNVDKPGALLSKTIEEYTYSYGKDYLYDYSYCCTNKLTGIDKGNCGSAGSCEYVTQNKNVFLKDDYDEWVVNRKLKETVSVCLNKQAMVTKKTLYEYSAGNPYLTTRVTSVPSVNESDPLTVRKDYEYDAMGNVVRETASAPYGKYGEQPVTVSYEYGDDGRNIMSKTTDPEGFIYTESYEYDSRDRLVRTTDANGLSTLYSYDNAFGSTITTTLPTGIVNVAATRWASGDDIAPKNALYYKWERKSGDTKSMVFYDCNGNVLRTVKCNHKQEPVVVDMEYDSRSQLVRQSNPYTDGGCAWTSFGYDDIGRLVRTEAPDHTITTIGYSGRYTTTTKETPDGKIHKTSTTVNQLGWTIESVDADGAAVSYEYYSDGRLKSALTSGKTVKVEVGYDHAGNRTSLSDPDYGVTTSMYDAFGRLLQQTTPKGCRTEYSYDLLGRLTKKVEDVDGSSVTYEYSYNETDGMKGTLGSIVQDNETVRYSYDEFLRPIVTEQCIGGETFSTSLRYDGLSRVASKTYPSGYTVNYRYYPTGLKHTITDTKDNLLWRTDDVNASGQLLNAMLGNGTRTVNEYDSKTHELLGSIVYDPSEKIIQNFVYRYDKFGNLAARKDYINNVEETFTYDDIDRLTGVTLKRPSARPLESVMQYDGCGRMTAKQMDGKDVFSMAQFGGAKPHAMESATASHDIFANVGQDIEYTSFDKVSRIKHNGNTLSYVYGIDNQRVSMTENIGAHVSTKKYVGSCEFIREDGMERVLTYLTGPYGVFAVVEDVEGVETLHYIHKDHLGSWTAITDREGNVEQRQSFDAWGNRRNATTWQGAATDEPLFDRGYTGHEHLYNFGLINMNGRMYDPLMSMFLSPDNYVQDPTSQQSFNRYAYCFYNPLKYTDPSGERAYGLSEAEIVQRAMNEARQRCWNELWFVNEMFDWMYQKNKNCFDPFFHGKGNGAGNFNSHYGGFYNSNGRYLGNNGRYDGKVYIVCDEQLSRPEYRATVRFIIGNSGNADAFTDDCLAYSNSIEITSYENRQAMWAIVQQDNGMGGKDGCNNREYGGYIDCDGVHEMPAGDVCDPKFDSPGIYLPNGYSRFHSHPSGDYYEYTHTPDVRYEEHYYYQKSPNDEKNHVDIYNAGMYGNERFTHYVFCRSNGLVYIYNHAGVQAIMKTNVFLKLKP